MNDWLDMECDEILNEAIMSDTPILVVEGVDDIPVYERISSQVGKKIEVIAVQNLKGMSEGNRGVIEFITGLEELAFDGRLEKYITGIIDRDARYYRGELVTSPALFILKWYSMESHFITRAAVKTVVVECTRIQDKLITPELIELLYQKVIDYLMSLFYLSLECLKKACIKEYDSIATYKMAVQHLRNTGAFEMIVSKKDELDEFAITKNIKFDLSGLLEICKGKWLVGEFCRILILEVKMLKEKCISGEIETCQFCYTENTESCLYCFDNSYSESQLSNLIKKHEGFTEFGYFKEHLLAMI